MREVDVPFWDSTHPLRGRNDEWAGALARHVVPFTDTP